MGFKIYLDVANCDLGNLIEKLRKIGDIIFVNNSLYIWLVDGKDKKSLSSLIKRQGVTEFFLQEITEDNVDKENGFAFAWAREHLNKKVVAAFEAKKQPELQQMLDNINKAREMLEERIEEAKNKQINDKEEQDGQ